MATISITYQALVAPVVDPINEICRCFYPNNAAADNAAFDGTYYDTNVEGFGGAGSIEKFVKDSVAHPGLVAALKQAVKLAPEAAVFETEDEKAILYAEELVDALASQGFIISVEKN